MRAWLIRKKPCALRSSVQKGGVTIAFSEKILIPLISVVVCTRNRGAKIAETVQSILRSRDAEFELVVVDQSDNDETLEAIQPLLGSPCLSYIRTDTRGLSAARNIGVAQARNERITPLPTTTVRWLPTGCWRCAAPSTRIRIAIVFGNALAGTHDRSALLSRPICAGAPTWPAPWPTSTG